MSEDKKLSQDKKYAQISKESVRYMAETIGIVDLSDEVLNLLAEDTNYRLREVVQNCGQFMRHSKRRKLRVNDINKVLKWNNVEPIYGCNTTEPMQFHYHKEADVYYLEEKEINIVELALTPQMFDIPGPSFVKAQWLSVEGIQKNGISSQGNNGKKGSSVPSVSDDLMSYYEQMTKAILGHDEELMKVAFEDLRTSSKIAPLLPYLINFVSVGVKKVSHDLTQLTKLVFTVNSLICNQSLYMEPKPYLYLLTQGLLCCILEPLAASINPTNDHWTLRDYAARLLAHTARNWTTPVNQLLDEILTTLRDVFADHTKTFSSHYGAIIGIVAFGSDAIEKYLLPLLINYWPHLSVVINNHRHPNAQIRADAHKVHGALIFAAQIIMMERTYKFFQTESGSPSQNGDSKQIQIKKEHREDKKPTLTLTTPISQVYNFLYECFGDSLSMRLPYIPLTDFYIPKSDPVINLFTSPELIQSGEELLEAFIVKEEEWQSMSADDEHSYDDRDDNSLLSDEGETEPVPSNMDLRIKSTVSDPNLGIKLTIAKLPRSAASSDSVGRSFKRKKLSIKIKKEKLEEPSEPEEPFTSIRCLGNRRVMIEFCFAGAMPIPEGRLKRNVILPNFNEPFVDTAVHCISLRMKKKGKLKKPCARKWWARKMMSVNLETII